jgi:outer membrane protein assembly factor BamB
MLPSRPLTFLTLLAIPILAASARAKDDGREPLWAAVRSGDSKAAQALLAKGADVKAKNEIGITALWIAASKGDEKVVRLLLNAGADVNASRYARGYDPATGKELWRLAKKSEATIPMPVIGGDLVYITSGNRPIQPIIAVRPGAAGDISLGPNGDRNEVIAWSKKRGGPCMTTPLVYGGYLYVCSNAGILTCYEADTGTEVYKERLGGISYTASPVAADGRLYFTTEQGEIRVVKAGPKFELLAVNDLGDVCMATPAISGGALFVRSQHYLFALGRK